MIDPTKERTTFGSLLTITDQLYLNRAIVALDEPEARRYMAKANLPSATLMGEAFTAVLHTARLNNTFAPRELRVASEEWLRTRGYPAPLFNRQ